jgi:rRNA-processing protein FCF1
MSSDPQEYFVIFDTNVLYHSYDKKANFSTFSFNGTYENVVGFINQLDIYERVTVVIPAVVWSEMERQIIDAHQSKIRDFREKATKHHFPEIEVKDTGDIDYSKFIHPIVEDYRASLSSDINKVIELPIASETRYSSIVQRAFDKRPPFEGKDKKSDKGFKDALLWESILEFASQHEQAKIIYYSKDNAFGHELEEEFSKNYPRASILICTTETAVQERLESWAKEIDIYSYTPIENYVENKEITDWLQSGDFLIQVIDNDFGLVEKNRLITSSAVNLIGFENIQITNQTENNIEYSIDAVLEVAYTFKDGAQTNERINVVIIVSHLLGEVFTVEDVYMVDEADCDDGVIDYSTC